MSDENTQESTDAVEVEFSGTHFGEDAVDTTKETDKPEETTEPAAEEAEETKEEEAKPEESPETEEATESETPNDETPDEPVEEKSESELKGLSREERREYFQNLNRQTQREVTEVVEQNYQPQPLQELQQYYMEQGADEFQALQLARQDVADQKAQISEASTQIAELNSDLRVDAVEARAQYDWMNPTSDNFDKENTEIAAQLFELATVKDPRTGQIVDAKMTPLQVATIVDKIRNSGSAKAALKAQKAAEKQMASAATSTSTAPAKNESVEDKQAAGLERALNQAM